MKILVFSFHFGIGNASGFATTKVVKELVSQGHDVVIIAGVYEKSEFDKDLNVVTCDPKPLSPARIFKKLGNWFGIELNYYFWEIRAYKKGKEIVGSFAPEILYGRGSPIASLTVASKLKSKFGIPLVSHFADPIPAPVEWVNDELERRKLLRAIIPIIINSDKLSFVTQEMIEYQQEITKIDLKHNSFVSPNTISESHSSDFPKIGEKFIFLFLGTLYGNRSAKSLIEGFEIFLKDYPDARIHFYGAKYEAIKKIKIHEKVLNNIDFFPATKKPFKIMETASVLVDIDADVKRQVFLSSKLLDYMSVNRFILSITPLGSPAYNLIEKLPSSTLSVRHSSIEVADCMKTIVSKFYDESLFNERKVILNQFYAKAVVGNLIVVFKKLIDS